MTKILGGIGEAFADRNFRIYSAGSITSWITYFIQDITFSWLAWEVTKSTTWLAVVAGLTTAATVVFIPLGGVLADRYDLFHMVRIAYGFDLLKTIALAILAFKNSITLPIICASAFLHGLIHSFSIPASYGMMPRFVTKQRLASRIAVSAAYTQFAVFAGPAIAGWILAHWGVAAAFSTNVAGYLIYFASTLFLVTPAGYRQAAPSRKTVRHDIIEGIRYVARHRGLASLLVIVLTGDSISASVYKLMPAYSADVLAMGVGGMSALLGAAGLGATVAALWLAHGGAARATPQRVLWALLGLAASVLLLAGSATLAMSFAAMLLFGFSQETRRTGTVSIMQTAVDDARRGRVMSSLFPFTQIAGGLGTMAVGLTARNTGLRAPLLVSALAPTVVWIAMFGRRKDISAAFAAKDDEAGTRCATRPSRRNPRSPASRIAPDGATTELVIFARSHARDGREAEVAAPSRPEQGCLGLNVCCPVGDPRLFYIHSRRVNEAAFELHAEVAHTVRFVERVYMLIDHPLAVTRMTLLG